MHRGQPPGPGARVGKQVSRSITHGENDTQMAANADAESIGPFSGKDMMGEITQGTASGWWANESDGREHAGKMRKWCGHFSGKKRGNSVWETARGDQICFNDVFIPSNKKSSAKKKRDKSTAYFCLDTNYMITPSSEKKIMAGGETTSLLAEIKN